MLYSLAPTVMTRWWRADPREAGPRCIVDGVRPAKPLPLSVFGSWTVSCILPILDCVATRPVDVSKRVIVSILREPRA